LSWREQIETEQIETEAKEKWQQLLKDGCSLLSSSVLLAFLVAFKPVRLGPFEEFRVELQMRVSVR